ncbi:Mnd1 family protein [Cryptosporidium hominis]|uniref:Meiotic nuclear division protein 1 n=2 Tax=Cryptosporidium hominis TaxID=237895 RepID=A0ABX5BGM4_CRYHO|nr:Mnd1 family [Cryptosporidium hominis]PPA63922.1 Mnd1 family protein [Cryptosporidium hominis]PPS97053.1 Meiotic nuclear division protein 1 [Cryptosporidium hominis]|eukprot:PPS97053.1 Meiotic nuclear division protein 1 [Cryptosporidium hominis]
MSKRGVSMEEKRSRLLNSLYEKKECFNLKEIEKLGKKCGIIEQTVKDVLQSLVDDSLVVSDKIGSLNIFWALPSAAKFSKENRLEYLKNSIQDSKEQIKSLEKMIQDSKETDSPEHQLREKKSQELDQILKEQKELVIRLDNINIIIKDNPKILNENLSSANQELSIWEDNVCSLRQWIKKKMPGISEKEINNNFGLPDDD